MRNLSYIFCSFLLFLCIIVFNSYLPYSEYGMKVYGVLGIIQLIFSIYSWKKITGSAITPYVIFLISAYIFTFGQSLLFVFGKVAPERDLMDIFSVSSIMPAQYLTLLFLNFFHIGGLLSCKKTSHGNYSYDLMTLVEKTNMENQIYGIKKIGVIFLSISIIPYIIERFTLFYIVLSTGYSGLYLQEVKVGISNLLSILSQYFVPGILCLLLVEEVKSRQRLFISLLIFEACFWLFTGGRSNGVIIASILIMYYHICIKPIKFKHALLISIAGFFFVSFLGVIAETRSDSNADVSEAFSKSMSNSNAFYSAISEMGGSMYPMIATMEIVPAREDFRYGSSYLYSATSIIPNFGFWDLHPAMKYGNLNDWLQNAMSLNYGPGYSIVAEAYINFGNWGIFMMMLLGYIFGLIFNINIRDKRNPLVIVLAFVFCFLIIKTVRNSFLATVRSIFYYIVPIYLIVVYMYKGRINNRVKR